MDTVVKAETGREQGTGPSRRLRSKGKLPGVVYGRKKDPIPVSVVYTELREALQTTTGMNTVFTLDVDGEQEIVVVRDVQRDPIKRVVTHADFLRVDPDVPISISVPLVVIGTAIEVAEAGALVEQKMHSIQVSVAPKNIPSVIEADVTSMTMDKRFSVADLDLPAGVTSLVADRITVAAPVETRISKTDEGESLDGEDDVTLDDAESSDDDGAADGGDNSSEQ
jgi:large subunit ribosomal protein L25